MVVAQLAEQLLPRYKVQVSNPVILKSRYLLLTFGNHVNKETEAGNGPFKKAKAGIRDHLLSMPADELSLVK